VLGLWGFAYIATHFLLIYVVLDKQVPFDPAAAWPEVVKDIAKRPYITVGFTGFLMLIPLAVTSTRGWIRRLGRRWTALHALAYVIALAGVVHFSWSVKADHAQPTLFGLALIILLGARLVPKGMFAKLDGARRASGRADGTAEAPVGG
jgi:sulfoxide reductase heme-binding subunit YedZ